MEFGLLKKDLYTSSEVAQALGLETYVQAAAAANIVLTPRGPGPGTSGMIRYPSGYTIEFGWAAPGLIVYTESYMPPLHELVPVPRTDPSPVRRWQRIKIEPNGVAAGAAAGGTVAIFGCVVLLGRGADTGDPMMLVPRILFGERGDVKKRVAPLVEAFVAGTSPNQLAFGELMSSTEEPTARSSR